MRAYSSSAPCKESSTLPMRILAYKEKYEFSKSPPEVSCHEAVCMFHTPMTICDVQVLERHVLYSAPLHILPRNMGSLACE